MKVSLNWLKEYVDIDLNPQELADKLSLSGTSVEEIIYSLDENIVVGEIKEIKLHPDADRLQIAMVYDGREVLQIVCGAPNIAVGQKVPLAKIGVKLKDFEIKKAQIRGVESYGMLCCEKELGLSEDHSGIKILDSSWQTGKKLTDYIKSDVIFDLEITPNRGDCLSHIGVAREVSAITKKDLKLIKLDKINPVNSKKIEINILEKELCPQYYAQVITGVKVEESPGWLKDKLISIGQKPINNIVDVTNYILFDLGQPLHAFDLNKFTNHKLNHEPAQIIVRNAKNGEKIICLDNIERKLDEKMLVIADSHKPIAIAGVIGGLNSSVNNSTTDIILECAEFESKCVRRTCKDLCLSTEASYRYERGIDSEMLGIALNKATKLITEIAGGKIDTRKYVGTTLKRNKITIDIDKINSFLGLSFSYNEIKYILASLGFKITKNDVEIQLWRHDIDCWQDIAEEIARIYGYEKIPLFEIKREKSVKNLDYYKKEYIKDMLGSLNFSETHNYPFLSEKDLQVASINDHDLLEIANPLQAENKYMRNSLMSGLLKTISKNPSFDPVLCFEIAQIFTKTSEVTNLAVAASGKNAKAIMNLTIEKLSKELQLPLNTFNLVEISGEVLNKFKIKKSSVYLFELPIEKLIKRLNGNVELTKKHQAIKYIPISKFPPGSRDLAFLLDKSVKSELIESEILKSSQKILLVELFDEFESDKLGVSKKSVAFHLWFQNMTKALTDIEIDIETSKIIENIEQKFDANLR